MTKVEVYTVKDQQGNILLVSENWDEVESVLAQSASYTYYTEE